MMMLPAAEIAYMAIETVAIVSFMIVMTATERDIASLFGSVPRFSATERPIVPEPLSVAVAPHAERPALPLLHQRAAVHLLFDAVVGLGQ